MPVKYLFGTYFVLQALIAHGANTEARGFGASTPLMLASIGGHLTALEVYTVHNLLYRCQLLHYISYCTVLVTH